MSKEFFDDLVDQFISIIDERGLSVLNVEIVKCTVDEQYMLALAYIDADGQSRKIMRLIDTEDRC